MKPWLIQRGGFKNINHNEITGIDSLISWDYMGSSEFEWGALPDGLKKLMDSFDSLHIFVYNNIKDLNNNPLYILCRDYQKDEVTQVIVNLFSDNPHRLKEWSGMSDYISNPSRFSQKTNFWWDIENDWMCCFGAEHINKLAIALNKTFTKKKDHNPNNPLPTNAALQARKEKITFKDDGKIYIINYLNKETKIVKRKIKSVDTDNHSLTIINRAGNERPINLKLPNIPLSNAIMKELKQWEHINA